MDSSLQRAAQNTYDLLYRYRPRVREDVRVVGELLEINPLFIDVPWVAEAAARLRQSPRSHRLSGRPKFGHTIDPGLVLGAVWALQMDKKVNSDRQAARLLEKHRIMSSTRVRRLLQEAKKDPRLLAQLSWKVDRIRTMPEEELDEILRDSITVEEG